MLLGSYHFTLYILYQLHILATNNLYIFVILIASQLLRSEYHYMHGSIYTHRIHVDIALVVIKFCCTVASYILLPLSWSRDIKV